jgi:hypothetical protein
MMDSAVLSAPLLVRGASCLGPWGGELCPPYPDPPVPAPPLEPVPKFVESSFNPLISFAVRGALSVTGEPPAADTGMVLASSFGDTVTADTASRRLAAGRPVNPLLFYQSIPNSILGHLGCELAMTGPIICFSAASRLLSEGLAVAESVLAEGAGQVLLIGIDLVPNDRIRAVYEARTACQSGIEPLPAGDIVAALVVQRLAGRLPGLRLMDEPWPVEESRFPQPCRGFGPAGALSGFVELCQTFADLRRGRSASTTLVHDTDAVGQHHTVYRASMSKRGLP